MSILTWWLTAVLIGTLAGCSDMRQAGIVPSPSTTATVAALPTTPPTAVPGSSDDLHDVSETVRQFGDAVAEGNDTVALLVLSPSAQQLVAASDLTAFLGESTQPQSLLVDQVRLKGDVAVAECTIRFADGEHRLHLQLVRLEGVWKIDAPVPDPADALPTARPDTNGES